MRAGEVARTIQDSSEQAEALSALGTALAQAGQWAAGQNASSAPSRTAMGKPEALSALGIALAQAGQWSRHHGVEAEHVIGTITGQL